MRHFCIDKMAIAVALSAVSILKFFWACCNSHRDTLADYRTRPTLNAFLVTNLKCKTAILNLSTGMVGKLYGKNSGGFARTAFTVMDNATFNYRVLGHRAIIMPRLKSFDKAKSLSWEFALRAESGIRNSLRAVPWQRDLKVKSKVLHILQVHKSHTCPMTDSIIALADRIDRFYINYPWSASVGHGDLWRSNIMQDDYGELKYIDFDKVIICNKYYDLVFLALSERIVSTGGYKCVSIRTINQSVNYLLTSGLSASCNAKLADIMQCVVVYWALKLTENIASSEAKPKNRLALLYLQKLWAMATRSE